MEQEKDWLEEARIVFNKKPFQEHFDKRYIIQEAIKMKEFYEKSIGQLIENNKKEIQDFNAFYKNKIKKLECEIPKYEDMGR